MSDAPPLAVAVYFAHVAVLGRDPLPAPERIWRVILGPGASLRS